jgi:hypothetical protein
VRRPEAAPAGHAAGWERVLALALTVSLGIVTLAYAWLLARNSLDRVSSEWALTGVEPMAAIGAMRVARGEALYRDFRHGRPVVPLPYGVLAYEAPGVVARALDLSDPVPILRLGRLQALAAALASMALLALLARQRGVPWRWAWLAAAPLLWFARMDEWFAKFTPDTTALMLSLAGWAILGPPTETRPRPPWPRAALAVALWTAGYHLKPTLLVGPVAFALEHVLGSPARRRAIVSVGLIAAGTAAAVVLTSLAVNIATRGLWSLNAISALSAAALSPRNIIECFGVHPSQGWTAPLDHLLWQNTFLHLLIPLWAALLLRRTPLAAAYFVALLLELVTMAKQGSGTNYLLGSTALFCVALAVSLRRGLRPSLFVLPVLLALLLWHLPKAGLVRYEAAVPKPKDLQLVDAARRGLPPGRVLCLDPFYALTRGIPFLFADGYHAALLSAAGEVDFSKEARTLHARAYDLVISNRLQSVSVAGLTYHDNPFAPIPIIEALADGYVPTAIGPWLVLWRPTLRKTPAAPTGGG